MGYMEKPPILQGSEQQQINAIRDYLFRMINSLEQVVAAPTSSVASKAATAGGKVETDPDAVDAIRKNARELQALIIKHAKEVTKHAENYTDQSADEMTEYNSLNYIARSVYGDFAQTVNSAIQTMAGQISEDYTMVQTISSDLQTYYEEINGQIRRGFIEDPDNQGSYITGIAISQSLQFDWAVDPQSDGTYTYYHLAPRQTFGLYTAYGWQFWIDGNKVGWFDSQDGMLHVHKVVAEEILQLSGLWQLKVIPGSKELEFVYIGE